MEWREELANIARDRHVSLLRFNEDEWMQLNESRNGINQFTIARTHAALGGIKKSSICLILGDEYDGSQRIYAGVLASKTAVTTLESRIKVRRAQPISPQSELELGELLDDPRLAALLKKQLEGKERVVRFSEKVSYSLINVLSSISNNETALRTILASVRNKGKRANNRSLQADAIQTALRVFDLPSDAEAEFLELSSNQDTALDDTNILKKMH